MRTQITLSRAVTYVLDGFISLDATFVGGADPKTGQPVTDRATIAVDQPDGDWSDEAVLREVAEQYPACDVAWAKTPKQIAAEEEAARVAALEAAKNDQ